jgi:ubiquinone/menaquinone biosynthesis C-methylase UbiE
VPRVNRPDGSTAEWREIAQRRNVLRNVLTWPDRESWSEDEFYATGREDWDDFRRHWQHYEPGLGGTCLEIGCGVGRMTAALARDFEQVIGVDVASDMLERARAVVPGKVELRLGDAGALPASGGEADAVFSVHVLQHLDHFDAMATQLREARRVLRPEGTLMVHIPLQSNRPPPHRRALIELRVRRSRRALARGGELTAVRMRLYQAEEVEELLGDIGFEDVELRVFAVRSNGFRHHFWLARAA